MLSNRLAFAALAVACLAAAGGGGYLASRQNAVPTPASAQTVPVTQPAPPATAAPAAAPAPAPVSETEAVVGDAKPVASPAKRPEKPREAAAQKSARATTKTPPPLTNTWPSSAAQQPPPVPVAPPPAVDQTPRPEEHTAPPPPPPAPEPPQKQFEDLVVSRDSVIGLQTETRVSSETAKVEDRVEARVTRDVRVADRIAIPAGSRAIGSVTLVERGGKFKEKARLGIRFHTLVLADGTRMPMNTETIFREGDSPANGAAAKIGGGAIGGAIIGAILGGAKGAAIGTAVGGGAGTAATAASQASTVILQPGTPLTVRLQSPVTITVEKE
jgi:hypothetical protein